MLHCKREFANIKIKDFEGWGYCSVIERLLSLSKSLGWIPALKKKKRQGLGM
jgi:hypothetical protein